MQIIQASQDDHEDVEGPGRLILSRTDKNVKEVTKMMMNNLRLTVKDGGGQVKTASAGSCSGISSGSQIQNYFIY